MEPHHVQAQVCQVEMWHCCRGFSMPTKTSGAEPASQQEKSLLCYSPESWGGTKRRWTCLRQTWSSSRQWSLCSGDQKKSWCLIISVTASIQARLQTSDKNDLRFFCGMTAKFREDFDGWYTEITHLQFFSAQNQCFKELFPGQKWQQDKMGKTTFPNFIVWRVGF